MQEKRWRRIYSDVGEDTDLAKASSNAERLYWRMMATADDYGNGPFCSRRLKARCVPIVRGFTEKQIAAKYQELCGLGLVQPYSVNGETFYHVRGFLETQPQRHGRKRKREFPASPYENTSETPTDTKRHPLTPSDTNGHHVTPNAISDDRENPTDTEGEGALPGEDFLVSLYKQFHGVNAPKTARRYIHAALTNGTPASEVEAALRATPHKREIFKVLDGIKSRQGREGKPWD